MHALRRGAAIACSMSVLHAAACWLRWALKVQQPADCSALALDNERPVLLRVLLCQNERQRAGPRGGCILLHCRGTQRFLQGKL